MPKIFHMLALLPLLAACSRSESVQEQVADPQVGDVYVVQFQPQGSPAPRYYFYHLFRVAPDSVYLHPARQDSPSPDADLRQLAFEPTPKTIVYTRAEVRKLLQPQPGDVTKIQLIKVRRPLVHLPVCGCKAEERTSCRGAAEASHMLTLSY